MTRNERAVKGRLDPTHRRSTTGVSVQLVGVQGPCKPSFQRVEPNELAPAHMASRSPDSPRTNCSLKGACHSPRMEEGARIALCQCGGRRLIGITISRFGRTLLRGLFDCTDVTVGSSTSNRVDLLIATGSGRSMSLLRVGGPGSERIAAFASG